MNEINKNGISVIVIFHNHEQFVTKRLNSKINQNAMNNEYIIIDDASIDGTHKKSKSGLKLEQTISAE